MSNKQHNKAMFNSMAHRIGSTGCMRLAKDWTGEPLKEATFQLISPTIT